MPANTERSYRWYVHPTNNEVGSRILEFLAENGISREESYHTSIIVDGKEIYGVYELEGRYVNEIVKHFGPLVTVFQQEGEGKIRQDTLYKQHGKRVRRSKPYKKVQNDLKKHTTPKT